MKKEIPTENADLPEVVDLEAITELAEASKELIPQMNVNVPATTEPTDTNLPIISNERLLQSFDEVKINVRQDREEIDEVLQQFKDLIFNGGDATTSSKEAVVNLLKIKLDTADKLAKIADLETRARGINTYKPYLTNNQNNTINIGDAPKKSVLTPAEKRALIEKENRKMEGQG